MIDWAAVVIAIFGPAIVVTAVWLAAKHGLDTRREPYIPVHDVRPFDARKIDWRNR